ncbi:MAG TPA: hypothetical protein VGJ60_07275 [Chloroflexota bacterium]
MATFITVLAQGYGSIELNLDQVRWMHALDKATTVVHFGPETDDLRVAESLASLSDRLPGPEDRLIAAHERSAAPAQP